MAGHNAATLNQEYAIDGVTFTEDEHGLVYIDIDRPCASARIAIQGGHLINYTPKDEAPVVWVSDQAQYTPGKAIRGGIPVCWPWFADHPTDTDKPAHGIARTSNNWQVVAIDELHGDGTEVYLALNSDTLTRKVWPHHFAVHMTYRIGKTLEAELAVFNNDRESFDYTAALHTYLHVGDSRKAHISGLDGCEFIDKVDGGQIKTQDGDIRFASETDNVYLNTDSTVTVHDPVLNRRLVVEKAHSNTTVVWNPWSEKAAGIGDFGDEEYLQMLCVEAANFADDVITVPSGEERTLLTRIRVEKGAE